MTDLSNAFKANHSAVNKSDKNGKLYANIAVWLNDEPDQYGNILSFQLNSKKDAPDEKVYFGSAKLPAETAPAPAKEGASASPAPAAKLTADFFRKNGTPEYLAKLEDGDYNSESTGVSVTISGGKVVAVNGELL
jgi:hypothetical protein